MFKLYGKIEILKNTVVNIRNIIAVNLIELLYGRMENLIAGFIAFSMLAFYPSQNLPKKEK